MGLNSTAMTMNKNISRISIQVGLGGYSFKVEDGHKAYSSEWMSAEHIFTTPEFQKRFDDVSISIFTPKFTLVPLHFFDPDQSSIFLSEVADIAQEDPVSSVHIPELAAVLVYSNSIGETLSRAVVQSVLKTDGSHVEPLPEIYYMLKSLQMMSDYNKILASYMDGWLYLVIAQGKSLLLCNAFQAPDFTTAQYFIFLSMKKLQLNPEVSTISFRTPLMSDQEMSLYRYFRSVEKL